MNNSFDTLLFRPHALSKIMTGVAKGWDIDKSKTCNGYLKLLHRQIRWNRKHQINNKYIIKGKSEEETGITMVSLLLRKFFKKNTERIQNDYLSGEVDFFEGKDIMTAEAIWDIKIAWDWVTFPYPDEEVEDVYELQGHGYMALIPTAKRHNVAHCLVNTPASQILQAKKSAWFSNGCPEEGSGTDGELSYKEACREIEINMIVDREQFIKDNTNDFGICVYDFDIPQEEWVYDIPASERIRIVTVERDEEKIKAIYHRIDECRAWMNRKLSPIATMGISEGIQESVNNREKADEKLDVMIAKMFKEMSTPEVGEVITTAVQNGEIPLSDAIELLKPEPVEESPTVANGKHLPPGLITEEAPGTAEAFEAAKPKFEEEKVPLKSPPPRNVPKEKKEAAQTKIANAKKIKKEKSV